MHAIHTFLLPPLPDSRFVENRTHLKECSDFDRRNVFIIQAAMTVPPAWRSEIFDQCEPPSSAYSTPNRSAVPRDADHLIHAMPIS